MPEQNPLSKPSHSPDVSSQSTVTKHLLQLLSLKPAPDSSANILPDDLMAGAAGLTMSASLDVEIEEALREAIRLWDTVTRLEIDRSSVSATEYARVWFEWPTRAGMGSFCPITNLLFRTDGLTQNSLQLLRTIRSDWRLRLVTHIEKDPSVDLTEYELQDAVKEIIGVYFARQFAMQADERQSDSVEPWLEMVQRSLRSR